MNLRAPKPMVLRTNGLYYGATRFYLAPADELDEDFGSAYRGGSKWTMGGLRVVLYEEFIWQSR